MNSADSAVPDVILRNMTALYLTRGEEILLLWKPEGRAVRQVWCASAGGHFEPDELNDPAACVLRELREETGLGRASLRCFALRYVTLRMSGREIRQNYYYFAALDPDCPFAADPVSNEGTLRWFREEETRGLPMPHSARAVLDHWFREGRTNDLLYGGVAVPEGVRFTQLSAF